jgi:uncharacterized membrane protein (UPF0136 family)
MDWYILAGYVLLYCLNRSRHTLVCSSCFLVVIAVQATYPENPTTNQITTSFALFSAMYVTLAYYLFKNRLLAPMILSAIMALYDLYYAADATINKETYTWVFNNHENIITLLHVTLMCLFIPKLNTTLVGCWYNTRRVLSNMLHIQPNRRCSKRAQGKEKLK